VNDAAWRPWTLSERRGFMKTLIDTHTAAAFSGSRPLGRKQAN
jgi:hypothetical protein